MSYKYKGHKVVKYGKHYAVKKMILFFGWRYLKDNKGNIRIFGGIKDGKRAIENECK